jgi:hypothetical protein
MLHASPDLADLKSQWPTLHDLDRAKAVHALKLSGIANRRIAIQIGVSESNLRRLLEALQARPEDQLLARQGTITTNELVRRAKSVMSIRAAKMLTRASIVGCNTICNWLRSEGMPWNTEQIVGEARRLLIDAEDHKRFPAGAVPPGAKIAEIIRGSRPAQPKPDGAEEVPWLAFWLAEWVYRSMPDERVRYKAVELALENESKGSRP